MTRQETLDQATDRELADRVLEGDELAFRGLYRRYTPRLWPTMNRMLGHARLDAEDCIQEAWIRAVRGLASFRWEAAFSTWLTGIAINCAREVLRKRSTRNETSTAGVLERMSGPRPDPGRRLDLEEAIAALPDGYRAVLVLHDLEGFTHPQISDRLEIAVGTSRSQLHHARRAIRKYLAGEGEKETNHVAR